MKRLDEPCFGKKRVGWGPAPKAWQGWLLTILIVFLVILDVVIFRLSIYTLIIAILVVAVFLIIASATSGKQETKESK